MCLKSVYVSTAKNPSANRESNASTLPTSDKQGSIYASSIPKRRDNNYLNYEFDFGQGDSSIAGIAEMDTPSEEDSLQYHE